MKNILVILVISVLLVGIASTSLSAGRFQIDITLSGAPGSLFMRTYTLAARARGPAGGAVYTTRRGFLSTYSWIQESLRTRVGQDGVWIFYGHGHTPPGIPGTADGLGTYSTSSNPYKFISTEELCDVMVADFNPPGILFLGGCSTHSLRTPLIQAGAKLVIGFSKTITNYPVRIATETFWKAFLGGQTLYASIRVANREIHLATTPYSYAMRYANRWNAQLVWEAAPWISTPGSQTLTYLLGAKRSPTVCATTGVCLFEHVRYFGSKLRLSASDPDLTDNALKAYSIRWTFWNDNISSVIVPAGLEVTLYEHVNYTGRKMTVTGPARLDTLPAGWNDLVSSIQVMKKP